jgi:hypothetical protein
MPKNIELDKLRDFFDKLSSSRLEKPLSKITISNYVSKLNKLSQLCTGSPFDGKTDFLMNPKKVVTILTDADITGKKDFLSPVLRLLKSMNADAEIITHYQKAMSDFKNDEYSVRKTNKSKIKNVENSLPYDTIKNKIINFKIKNDTDLIAHLICSFYFMGTAVPRNDLNLFKFANANKKGKELNNEFNFILVDKEGNPVNMVFNSYKTNTTFGSKKFGLTPYLQDTLKRYIRHFKKQNGDFVFLTKAGVPYKKGNMLDLIGSSTELVLGKKMSVNLMRQIQITDYYRDGVKTIEQDEKDAERYLHSLGVHKEYLRTNLKDGSDVEGEE